MNKTLILEKLEMLVKLCEKTEPDVPNEKQLFSDHIITVNEMLEEVRISTDGSTLTKIMRQANRIWRIRNKIKNGDWDDLSYIEMTEQIEDYIAQGHKINAIKYYRQEMNDKLNEQVTLREAKEYIDGIASDMRLRGIIK
jgi:ribosomal protein L7/L12